jgi:hypothetical protein
MQLLLGDRDRLGRFQPASRRLVAGAESIHRLVSHCRSPDAFGETPKAADEDVRTPQSICMDADWETAP